MRRVCRGAEVAEARRAQRHRGRRGAEAQKNKIAEAQRRIGAEGQKAQRRRGAETQRGRLRRSAEAQRRRGAEAQRRKGADAQRRGGRPLTLVLPIWHSCHRCTTAAVDRQTAADSRGCTNSTGGGDQWAPGGDRGRLIPLAPSLPLRLAADRALMSFKQTF